MSDQVGIADAKLSEKLQMDAQLTLEKAVNIIRQAEHLHSQQDVLRGASSHSNIAEIKSKTGRRQQQGTLSAAAYDLDRKLSRPQSKSYTRQDQQRPKDDTRKSCCYCGKSPSHQRSNLHTTPLVDGPRSMDSSSLSTD